MTEHYVHIFASPEDPFPPTLEDDQNNVGNTEEGDKEFTTEVYSDDTMTWSAYPARGNAISTIDKIEINSGAEYFSSLPTKDRETGEWNATLGESSKEGDITYTIYYTANRKQYKQDPKLRFRPRT